MKWQCRNLEIIKEIEGHKGKAIIGEEGGRRYAVNIHCLMRIHARAYLQENNGAYSQAPVLREGSVRRREKARMLVNTIGK